VSSWYCALCDRYWKSPGRLSAHAMLDHGANRAVLERAQSEMQGGATLVRSDSGRLMLMIQAPLML
jgi:hypothetical protein